MPLVTIGLNHKNTPLDILGKAIIPSASLRSALNSLCALPIVKGAVILSTCNRCEIYAEIDAADQSHELHNWFYKQTMLPTGALDEYGYTYHGETSVTHLMRVASSIDSMIVGEPQILGQVKAAYQTAAELNYTSSFLIRLFEKTFAVAKQVRTQTDLGKYPVSYASAVLELTQRIFEKLSTKHALFIGTGDMISLTASHFYNRSIGSITIAGRSQENARRLAQQFNGNTITLSELPECLARYDIIVSCTASDTPLLDKATVQAALKKRKHRPVCIADIALPCDVESAVGTLEDVYLYPLEKLAHIVNDNQSARLQAAYQAEIIVTKKAHEYYDWINSQKVNDMIKQLRDNADNIRNDTLQKTLAMLKAEKTAEEVITYLSTTLTKRLMHIPTQTLKIAAENNHYELLTIIKQLLEQENKK